jgi:hypothetical protein
VIALLRQLQMLKIVCHMLHRLLVQNADGQTSWKTHEEVESEVSLSLKAALLELCVTTHWCFTSSCCVCHEKFDFATLWVGQGCWMKRKHYSEVIVFLPTYCVPESKETIDGDWYWVSELSVFCLILVSIEYNIYFTWSSSLTSEMFSKVGHCTAHSFR